VVGAPATAQRGHWRPRTSSPVVGAPAAAWREHWRPRTSFPVVGVPSAVGRCEHWCIQISSSVCLPTLRWLAGAEFNLPTEPEKQFPDLLGERGSGNAKYQHRSISHLGGLAPEG